MTTPTNMGKTLAMIFNRRVMLGSTFALAMSPIALADRQRDWRAIAVEDTAPPLLPPDLLSYSDQPSLNGPLTDYQPFGTHPPTTEEQELARKVLSKVPANCTPIDVALYFLDVGAGKFGPELRPYITAWPLDWNPVIVEFFKATDTQPSGDTTSWCAAFVNFCLIKAATGRALPAGSAEPTRSAASSTFRYWSHQIKPPANKVRPGDIAVFRNKQSPGYGHVGFFLTENDTHVLVLGGNQFEGTPIRHTINRKWISKDSRVLQLHSYRTDPQLRA